MDSRELHHHQQHQHQQQLQQQQQLQPPPGMLMGSFNRNPNASASASLMGFFTLYFCKCFLDAMMQAWRLRHGGEAEATENPIQPPEAPTVNPGLELRIINSFPTFPYSSVKDLREEKYGLECAICLLEFDGDHVLRLLTTCYHVFHQECIDLWFESHKTCPVCRHDLDPPPQVNTTITLPNVDEMIIDVIQENSDDDQHHQTTTQIDTWPSSGQNSCLNNERSRKEQTLPDKFSRSHSTGHSIVRNKPEEEDRYTLRLPEHVKIKVTRGHGQTESCVTFGEIIRNKCDHRRLVILGKATRFVCASKLLLSCYNKGIKIPSSVRRAVFSGLRMSGCFGEARMAKAKMKLIQVGKKSFCKDLLYKKAKVGKRLSELIWDSAGQSSGTDQVSWQAAQVSLDGVTI
ncbi:hypothetical protein F2Q68_00029379 [Brassica cretica]|uniref:RING-type E3 ubiquitin transferase n=1 Tax=Brassica cretica TaxID=69181 RepID=A0A8S9GCJ8_BRACR|nr:hypothetical protein F2Q68_00029379 [Brassica cretica]